MRVESPDATGTGLIVEPDQKSYRQFVLRHNPGYENCDMIPFLELLDWANHVVPSLIGLATRRHHGDPQSRQR